MFKQGDPPDGLYYLIEGKLLLSSKAAGEGEVTGMIYPSEIFGEYSLLVGESRPADVTAGEPSKIVRIPGEVFENLVEDYPGTALNLARIIIIRQQSAALRARL